MPRQCAINYHDALLPRYAGFYPTSWALMHGEATHGVTWHVITELIDAGDILRQAPVDIAADDTAFTLNAKCYDAALRSFAALVEDLAYGRVVAQPQDLRARTFSSFYHRPPAGCTLSWEQGADTMAAFVRALDFGPYANLLGLPKLALGKDFFIIPKIDVLDSSSTKPPGTVIAIEPHAFKVATATRDIALRQVLTIDGQPLPLADLVAQHSLQVGDRFHSLDQASAECLTARYATVCQHEDFWVERLATLQPAVLPYTARQKSPAQAPQYATVSISLPPEMLSLLQGRWADWRPGDVFLTAFAAYLARLGGASAVDVGFRDPELQRHLAGVDGFFAAYVPLRLEVDQTQNFAALFQAVRAQVALVRQHETYARDVVVRYPLLRSTPDRQRGPVLPIMVVQTTALENDQVVSGSEFTMLIGTEEARWVYNTAVLGADDVLRMAGQFATFVQSLAANPEQCLSDLPLLSAQERQQLLVEFNSTTMDYPHDRCFQQLYEAQAERTPAAIAVVYGDLQLTYRELNARANQLAHYLSNLGVGSETLVGLCMERSVEMLVGLLGVLKAGGAYVPLDPAYPAERLAMMLADTQAPVVLTQERLLPGFPGYDGRVVCLDTHWDTIAQGLQTNPPCHTRPDHLAYVLYTSGSTGRPNGVMIEHRSLVNYLWWANNHLLGDTLQLPTVTGLSFDACLKQLFAPLLRGAAVWLLPSDVLTQPAALLQALQTRSRVGLNCVPSLWAILLDAMEAEPTLRPTASFTDLLVGGERLSRELVDRSRALLPHLTIWNLYGPTEATANAGVGQVASHGPVTIGRPIANTRLYILDAHRQPLPIGVAGELYIGGIGLARGYLHRSELTQQRFILDPFAGQPEARLYKTGDLVRYLPTGEIEFLGRTDEQVKIRGHRIELGEIEGRLRQFPAVRDTVVRAREASPSDTRLVAYVVAAPAHTPVAGELRDFLQGSLPDYMMPSAFVFLEALPLMPNGKINRNMLPAPEWSRAELQADFVAPRTPVEALLAAIWRKVLALESAVGIHDNFFDLGGHSLLATQIISRLRSTAHIELPLRSIFESPTIAGLAARVEAAWRVGQGLQVAPPLQPYAQAEDCPLSFAQQRLWFLDRLEPGNAAYNIAVAFRLSGILHSTALAQSLNEIVRRHAALRTTFTMRQGQPVQVVAPDLTIPLPVVDLQHVPEVTREAQAQQLTAAEATRSFDLSTGPLIRATVLQLAPQEHILLLTMHHIVSDGWSLGVLFHELAVLYQAFSTDQPSPLPALPIQYTDFALWQRQWLQGSVLATQLAYWEQQIKPAPPVLDLPLDYPRPPVQTYRGARQSCSLSPALSTALKTFSHQENVTLYMTLLAALQTLLHRYTGQDDIAVGAPIAGRQRVEVEGLIGFFLNSLALRTDLSGNPSFREVLARVRQVALGAYSHQDLPFEKLLEELHPERDRSRTPLFQVFLNMNRAADRLELVGLTTEPLVLSEPASLFDFTLYVREDSREIDLTLVYNIDLFTPERMAEMLQQLQALLGQIVETPEAGIHTFTLLTAGAQQYLPEPTQPLAADWKGAVHTGFSRQARQLPQQLALVDNGAAWTYQELAARSSQLAHYFLGHGIKPHDIVAIYGHRSAPLVLAVLGILKAGAAFLILDPAYPATRLTDCLQMAQPRGWVQITAAGALPESLQEYITSAAFSCRVQLPPHAMTVAYDVLNSYSTDDPGMIVQPGDLSHIAFTSGSTGRPKGIRGRHGSLSHFLPWQAETFHISAADRFAMLSGLSHDPLQRDIFTPLWLGATLCIPPPDSIGTSRLAQWMAAEQITCAHMSPAMAELLANTAAPDCCLPALRYAFFIGDKLTRQDAARLRSLAPGARCIASYGSTETQRAVGYYLVPHEPERHDRRQRVVYPLGKGMQDVQLLVLTATQHLAGIGEIGEIYMRSPHLALGYLGDTALTQERFLTNPFTGVAEDRLYRTGDLGRYLPDGNVEFAGRADRQLNIRGFRVEPEEIEAVLGQHDTIQQALVLVREDTLEQKRLVAYLVARGESFPTPYALQSFLKARLPEYMVPTLFVFLAALPLTPNGKVDYDALPVSDQHSTDQHTIFLPPRTPTEEKLAGLWADILKVSPVGIHHNFFELGGHSLLATQLITRVHAVFQVEIPLRILFESPTLADLAAAIVQQQAEQTESEALFIVLEELEQLSEDEAKRILSAERREPQS